MGAPNRPRHGSLQFWPRCRAEKALPRVNWSVMAKQKEDCLLGLIGYKVGMTSVVVKDDTLNSMMKGKKITIPVTILEVPNMKIYSVRFYRDGKVCGEIVVSNDKELKRVVGVPKVVGKLDKVPEHDDVRAIIYSIPSQTSVKKTPDLIEVAINAADKLAFIKGLVGKELSLKDMLKYNLVDARGLTKGKGFEGPVPRFGLDLKNHKSEKGVRRPGSLAPWHPARVTFRTPHAGQLGMFTRVIYNLNVIGSGTIAEKNINPPQGFTQYGNIKSSYVIIRGSIQGPQKRQILLTPSFRPTKFMAKKKYELVEVLN